MEDIVRQIQRCLIDNPSEYPDCHQLWNSIQQNEGFAGYMAVRDKKESPDGIQCAAEFSVFDSAVQYESLRDIREQLNGMENIADIRLIQMEHWTVFIDIGRRAGFIETENLYNEDYEPSPDRMDFYTFFVPLSIEHKWIIALEIKSIHYRTIPFVVKRPTVWFLHKKKYFDAVNNPNDSMSAGTLLLLASSSNTELLDYSEHDELKQIMSSANFQSFANLKSLKQLLTKYVRELRKWWHEFGSIHYEKYGYHFVVVIGIRFDDSFEKHSHIGSHTESSFYLKSIDSLDVARIKPSGYHIVHFSVCWDVATIYNALLREWTSGLV